METEDKMTDGIRRIWVIADAHIGKVSDGADGADWFEMSLRDICAQDVPVDYGINLGDVTHGSAEEQFARYRHIRDSSSIRTWFEVCGNHDFAAMITGLRRRYIETPRYWTVTDGNMLFISLPAERGNAAGMLVPEVEQWLRRQIAANSGRNIVVCAHQFPRVTVFRSAISSRCLYPLDTVERFARETHVDLWLGGHIHGTPRTVAATASRYGTVFMNAASISHVYNTGSCNSFLLEVREGAGCLKAFCRDHDRKTFLSDQYVEVPLRYPAEPGSEPVLKGFDLDVPERYRNIEPEQVTADMF